MKIGYSWLKELTGVNWSAEEMAERLTLCGTACEEIISTAEPLKNVVVGKVTELHPVEGADKIQKATVNIGEESLSIICGAPNVAVGQYIPVALIGAKLANGLEIKKVKIRGVESTGMICSQAELGITDDHSGIWALDGSPELGQPLVDFLDFDDYILNFELTPDRADSMSAFGIARDLAALNLSNVSYPEIKYNEANESADKHIKVAIEDSDACPRFTARIIKNLKKAPSPWWIQKKLIIAGMRPISNIVDVTNLVMLETGNPIHAFDFDNFGSDEVLVRRAKDGEKLKTLDGKEHTLTPEVLLITNGKEAKAAAGVMGGFDSEVSDDTTNVLLEVAYFNPTVIRKSRKQLKFTSEASMRFEKGVDPDNVPNASARVAQLFEKYCGGEVLKGVVDCYPKPINNPEISFRPQRCNSILGTDIKEERMIEIFKHLEFDVKKSKSIQVTAPTFRHDIKNEIDLIEEVARIDGYDSIPDAIENIGPLFTPTHNEERFENKVRKLMTSFGFDEILGHGLADSKTATSLLPEFSQLKIINPVSVDLDIMRNSLIQTGLQTVSHNIAHRNIDLKLFELGRAYFPPDKNGEWLEDERLLMIVTGSSASDWRLKPRLQDFYDLTGPLEQIFNSLGMKKGKLEQKSHQIFDEAVSYTINMNSDELGIIGKISDKVLALFDIKQPVYLAEIKVSSFISDIENLWEFSALPTYPAAPRDLAIVVDETVMVGDLLEEVKQSAGIIAESVNLFDFYQGKQIEKGKKSLGVAIIYRSKDRSLSSEEVEITQNKVVKKLQDKFGAEIRDS